LVPGRTQAHNANGCGQIIFNAVVVTRFFDESAFERCHMSGKNPVYFDPQEPDQRGT
jgi:hypothetical protein